MKSSYLIALVFPLLLVACGGQDGGPGDAGDDAVVLVAVDGAPVTLAMLETVMEARGVSETDHERMRELLDELIRTQVVANAAQAQNLDDEPDVRAELRLAEIQTLFRHYLDRAQQAGTISEQELRDVYTTQLERSGDTQYRIEVIAYGNQASAEKAISRLESGEIDYAALRTEAQSSGRAVEEPGWIDRSQVPQDFAASLAETETGEVVPLPLQNPRGGWFLVRVKELRALQAPSFDEVRDGIARSLRRQQSEALVESLYDQAEITPMLPLDEAEPEAGQQQ